MTGRLPTFVIVGAQKSGTTSLIHYLGGHPEVFALPTEVHFFDRHFELGVDWYRERFASAGPARAVGESTPEYMYDERVAPLLARTVPDARLVVILRDPVDRAYSQYWHNRTRGHEPLSFERALAAEEERLADPDPVRRARYAYADRGRYAAQLERLCSHFRRDAVDVVFFEELRDDRVEVVRRLYRSLGVDPEVVPPVIRAEKNRFVTFRSQRLRGPIRRLPGPLRRVAARLNIRYTQYPPLVEETRRRLARRFADDNRALAAWLGRDLPAWTA